MESQEIDTNKLLERYSKLVAELTHKNILLEEIVAKLSSDLNAFEQAKSKEKE